MTKKLRKNKISIKVTSDWAIIEFKGIDLNKVEIEVGEEIKSQIQIQDNKISLFPKKIDDDYCLEIKFLFLVQSKEKIESIVIEKGDSGEVDVEINGQHFIHSSNISRDGKNRKEMEVNVDWRRRKKKIIKKEMIEYPSILIVTPTKNDACYFSRHLKTWEKVDYPREKIRWVWIYGESKDNTKEILVKYFSEGKWNCEIYSEPQFRNLVPDTPIWIADILNSARKVYKGEDFVILDDSDIVEIPSMILRELVNLNLDIVAPYVWHDGGIGNFYDTYVFRNLRGKKYPCNNVPYMYSKKPIELNSVGTLFMVKGKIFKDVSFKNPVPNMQFCRNAKKKGYKVWAAPWINIFHADVFKEEGKTHLSVEHYVKEGILPKIVLKKMK